LNNILSSKDPAKAASQQAFSGASKKVEKTKTPVLDNFGRDLTKLGMEDKLDRLWS